MGTVATGTTTVSPTFAQATTAGNLLVAWVGDQAGNHTTSASGWTLANTSNKFAGVWYKPNCGASETAPTFTSAGGQGLAARLAEFSGGATSSPVDQVGQAAQTNGGSLTATSPSADITSGDLIIGVSSTWLSKTGTDTTTQTYNNGVSATNIANNDASSVQLHYRFAWGTTTGNSGADTLAGTDSSMNIVTEDITVVSFKLFGAVATTLLAQPCAFAGGGLMMKRLARTWRNRRRSGILVPDLWLPAPVR